MTIKKSWLKTSFVLLATLVAISACGGKKAKSEQAAKTAAPLEDITLPPQIIAPKDDSEKDDGEDEAD